MPKLPIIVLMIAAAALGAANLRQHFRGVRKPLLIGAHLLLALGALEVLVFYLKDANSGEGLPAGTFGNVAAALMAAAAFAGLLTPVLGRKSPQYANMTLTAHVGCGAFGLLAATLWVLDR